MTESRSLLVVTADPAGGPRWVAALQGLGTVRVAGDVREALALIWREKPAATVLAGVLPAGGSVAVARAVPDPASIVALVSADDDDHIRELVEVGVFTQLPNAIPPETARRVVERMLARGGSDSAEKLRRVLAAVSHARHEINNPLTSILAETQLLLMDAATLAPEVQRSAKTVQEMAMRIRDVVRALQDLKEPP